MGRLFKPGFTDPADFAPPLLRIQEKPPAPLAGWMFRQYGMAEGRVEQVSADATEAPSPNTRSDALTGRERPMGPLAYRTVVALKDQVLQADEERFPLTPGMQVAAEIRLGTRTILEYLLSPVQKPFHEAARER